MSAATRPWLITGGAGYIGAHVVRELTRRGVPVVVYDDLSTGLRSRVADVPVVVGSVLDEPLLTATLREHGVAGVMHLAAHKQVSESMTAPLRYYRDNIDGLRAVLSAMQQAGVDRIVYTSSAAVYGENAGRVTERSDCLPANPYGVTKLVGEWMLRD
ncbi:MAG: NAD-dependent epimerase/dehydratase family protein, partial [Sciscionella sp.]